jgi:hypothetical protein
MNQVADRMGSISQRAMLCHRGHHEGKVVLRWSLVRFYGLKRPEEWMWINLGNKCKHCGRWV